ncbi:DUF2441 domain-containing protein [Photobacterium frigidiphilum]|uniref:DUF2441 domain-containing protein n=1 Tax=Photobacterium frigidiphilum TaxID=264736 RepID=UPI003D0E7A90
MKIFYAVDREGRLNKGEELSLDKHEDISPDFLQSHVDGMFPDGMSVHGEKYFLSNDSKGNIASPAIELLFEYVRKSDFPEVNSRFQSFFACETLDDARLFRNKFGDSSSRIFEIHSSNPSVKVNMNLLSNGSSTLVCSYFAQEYWMGHAGPDENPFWEVLLSLPILVSTQVE